MIHAFINRNNLVYVLRIRARMYIDFTRISSERINCFKICINFKALRIKIKLLKLESRISFDQSPDVIETLLYPALGRVGRVTDCGVRGLRFKSPGLFFTSRTESSCLSRVVRVAGDPWSVPLSGWKILLRWSLRLAVEQPQLFRKVH